MTDMQQAIAKLDAIAARLEVGVFCNRWEFWYVGSKGEHSVIYRVENKQPIPLPYDTFVGFVEMIDFQDREFKGDAKEKLRLLVVADKPYHLQAGSDTAFAHCIYAALQAAQPEDLTLPVRIELSAGEQGTVFATVYKHNGKRLRAAETPDWKTGDWSAFKRRSVDVVEAAMAMRGRPSRLRKREDDDVESPTSQPTSQQAQPQQPDRNPEANFQKLKWAKDTLKWDAKQVVEVINESSVAAKAQVGSIQNKIRQLTDDETCTVLLTMAWNHGLQQLSEDELKPLYSAYYESIDRGQEQRGLNKFLQDLSQLAVGAPAKENEFDGIPF